MDGQYVCAIHVLAGGQVDGRSLTVPSTTAAVALVSMRDDLFVDSPARAALAICAFGCLDELVSAAVHVDHLDTHFW